MEPMEIVVPDCVYDNFMAQVTALPEKKRKMWRGKLEDKWGTITKCVYKHGNILNWCILPGEYRWAVVEPRRTQDFIPVSSVGAAMTLGDEAGMAAIQSEREANHTGNHYRNKKVGVPKQADGRARG